MRLPLATVAALTAGLLLTGCMSVRPGPAPAPPDHRPAGQTSPLPSPPAPAASTPAPPRGLEELAWIGKKPKKPAADRKRHKRPTVRPDRPRRTVPTPWRARPSSPRTHAPAAPPRTTQRRWVPSTPRVPTGGGMRSVCRSAKGIVSPGVAGMCRSVGR
ncbi:hypothetical protein [Streptomyces globisporus]|uniref:hypothetical protein n=1 Tax=Streptomyces globisporus TaxID=1908 RepID=UPI0034617A8B|nr:hypothetical protein OG425_35220 [Streptomyces globisporus]